MSVFVKSIRAMLRLFFPGGINKDPTVWLDGARTPPTYVFKKYEFKKLLKILPTRILHFLLPQRNV